ncbi:MAG: GNAT family N-acetyltransferase [Terracidiphilus sp.]|jgi:hypothetical protein
MTDNGRSPGRELEGGAYLRKEQTVTFRLQLGEFVFSRKSFNAVVLHFELGERPDIDALAKANLDYGLYDLVFFPNVDATLRTGILRWSSDNLWYAPGIFPLYCVDLTCSFDQYRRHFSKSVRSHLKRDREKFKQLSGGVEYFREYRRPEEMRDFYFAARSISAKTYQERLLGAGLPDSPEFIEDLIRRAEQDLIRGYILYDKDHPVAFGYCSGRDSRITYHTTGYDPAYADYSPGRVLLYCLLERLYAERRFELFDFDMGEAIYKSVFSTHSFICANIYCFRLSARNITFVIAHAGLAAVSRTLVRLTHALGIKDKIKKWTRANLRR